MTRFANNSNFEGTKRFGSLTTMASAACDANAMSQCYWALDDAVWLLKRCEAALSNKNPSSEVKRYANRYFLTDTKTIDATAKMKMLSIINLTLAGLKGDVTIKVGDIGAGTNGSVAYSQKDMAKPYHNKAHSLGRDQLETKGAIKISDGRIAQGRLGVKTLIHEATHKYAGTRDYCYFKDDGVTPRSAFDDKTLALQNADSYAWFVLKTGRSWNIFASNNLMFA